MLKEYIKKSNILEIIFFCIFIILAVIIAYFHEPWVDEIQAWQISKDSLYNILFVIPHYEAHPPLWHIILKCFSSLGCSPDVGLKVPNLIFMISAVWLLIFKSPFNRIVRLTLPYTYFIFYQYTAISRPYCIFCFAMLLAAYFYKTKNEHPYKYIFSLTLLSLSCIYGMILASGITIAWAVQILMKEKTEFLKNILKDKRFKAAIILFFICLINTLMIYKYPDSSTENEQITKNKFLYVFFCLICDSLTTSIAQTIHIEHIHRINYLYCIYGTTIYIILFYILRFYKVLLLFIIPYLMFLVFSLFFISIHHIGLLMLFYIFVFWAAFSVNTEQMEENYKKIVSFSIFIIICIQLHWGLSAYYWDIKQDYWYSKTLPQYIKEYNLEKYLIMDFWLNDNMNIQPLATVVSAYSGNIFYNFSILNPEKEYSILKKLTENDKNIIKEELNKKGIPEIYIGLPNNLAKIFDKEQFIGYAYELLTIIPCYPVFKAKRHLVTVPIYARDDIYNEIKK